MSIRYFEIYQESDRDNETERYLSSNRTDSIMMASADWWGLAEYRQQEIDYFCVEEFEVDDDFGERTGEVVVRTWKYADMTDFSDLSSRNALRALVNIANSYNDDEFEAFCTEAEGTDFCNTDSLTAELKTAAREAIEQAWNKSRAGGNF